MMDNSAFTDRLERIAAIARGTISHAKTLTGHCQPLPISKEASNGLDQLKDAVFGNVGSICAFRVGDEDAQYLESQFSPVFTASDLVNIDNFNAHLKLLSGGRPMKPFNIRIAKPGEPDTTSAEQLKQLSYEKNRSKIEDELPQNCHFRRI